MLFLGSKLFPPHKQPFLLVPEQLKTGSHHYHECSFLNNIYLYCHFPQEYHQTLEAGERLGALILPEKGDGFSNSRLLLEAEPPQEQLSVQVNRNQICLCCILLLSHSWSECVTLDQHWTRVCMQACCLFCPNSPWHGNYLVA